MSLRLPRWEALSQDEQVPVINLPIDQDLWVTGGPGTGKTVMALYRANQALAVLRRQGVSSTVVFMIYNKTLRIYLQEALQETAIHNADATTWHSWLYRTYARLFHANVPEVKRYSPDWDAVRPAMVEHYETNGAEIDHLFIDEAQDLPVDLLAILRSAAKVISTFSDPNQRIVQAAADHAEIGRTLNVSTRRYRLMQNYRNTAEIARVADVFRDADERASLRPPTRHGEKPKAYEAEDLRQAMEFVAVYADNNPELHVGVLVPDFDVRTQVNEVLEQAVRRASLSMYTNKGANFTFANSGLKVLMYDTAKGLEFDTVFLPLFGQEHARGETSELQRNRLFVACTRARNELYFLHAPQARSWAMDALVRNQDQGIVEWYTLRPPNGADDSEDLAF